MKNPVEEFLTEMTNTIQIALVTVTGWVAFMFGRIVYKIKKNKWGKK